jgi:acetyl esterase/lipase
MHSPSQARKDTAAQAIGLGMRVFQGPAPALALALHLHGGSFQEDAANCHDAVARLLAEAGAVVVSVDYPTGPAHPFPAALNAAFHALQGLAQHRAVWAHRKVKLFVAGEESGGNLAAALAMMARDQGGPQLAGQILISPMLDPCLATASLRGAEAGPVGCRWADGWHSYLGTADQAAHPYAAPANASRLAGLAPALVLTAEDDPLRDEALRYGERLAESGIAVERHVLPGPTGWPTALADEPPAQCPCAAEALRHFRQFLARTASVPSPISQPGQGALT